MDNPLDRQPGGNHYKRFAIQPVEFIEANNLGFLQGSIIKRVCRLGDGGKGQDLVDLDKIIHEAQLLKQLRYGGAE